MKKFKGWKSIKKNEIAIYAIALMLVTAGYFNYTKNLNQEAVETSTKEAVVEEIASNTTENANIGDARLVSNNEVVKENNKEEIDTAISTEEPSEEKKEEEKAIDTNAEAEKNVEDYFVNTKLERDTGYAGMISTYTKILEDNTVSETQKAIAMKEITKINNDKNAISVCENILTTKGFQNIVVLVNNDSVNVVVKSNEKLKTAQVAQIQNVVAREFGVKIENIHITEKE